MTAAERRERVQSLQPPYLVTNGTDHRGVLVGITADASTAVVEMVVHGGWSQQLGRQVTTGLGLCLAGPSAAIIVDLHDMADLGGASLRFWSAVAGTARLRQAPVQLAFCPPPATMLDYRLRHLDGPQPPVFATVPEARMAIAGRLSGAHRVQARLAPRPASVWAARDLVAQACHTWHLPQLRDDAALVMLELAANAVEHARTDFVVTVSRDGRRVHLAVRDGATRYPHLSQPSPGRQARFGERGRGLRLIHTTAAAWGAMPARGGKVVWATVSTGPGRVATP